jgi:transcriptional regulator with XRE-family HTH domain
MRQQDVADRARVSQSVVSRLERGHVDALSLPQIEAICAVLEIRVELFARWRGGDAGRLLSAAHASMHEAAARWFARLWPAWTLAHEVTFAVYGERGVIDILAWHATSRTLLIVELKTELVDLNELVGTADRRRRLARAIAAERGWRPAHVGVWIAVAAGRTNRRHVADHSAFLRNAFPADGTALRRWLATPLGPIAALSLESFRAPVVRTPKRVRAVSR